MAILLNLVSPKSEDLFLVHPVTVVMTSSSSTGLINKLCSLLSPKQSYIEIF